MSSQCFLSLSDTSEPEHGGFEAAAGFHREFAPYFARRARETEGSEQGCVFDFTAIRDGEVLRRVKHVAVKVRTMLLLLLLRLRLLFVLLLLLLLLLTSLHLKAGEAVFWDQRLPHANSQKHLGNTLRRVLYGGFLPRVAANAAYAEEQRAKFAQGAPPSDFWIEGGGEEEAEEEAAEVEATVNGEGGGTSALGEYLLGL